MTNLAPATSAVRSTKLPEPQAESWLGLRGLSPALGLLLLAVAACWLLFFNSLRGEWAVNAQYNYGYIVPFLGIALLCRRWAERPNASSTSHAPLAGLITAALFFLVLPVQMILEANPEWRLIYWLNGFQVVGLAFCLLCCLGGGNWVRYFAPPLWFMLIAVPWPMGMETAVIQGLMRLIAGLTVEVAGWFNIPAVQHGNLIEVGVGIVGIDEACSGVRSLQSALMISLFLGELHRFTWQRRIGLLGASLLFVLLANLTRTSFLVWAAANRGMQQMESWHDTAGILIMLIVLPGLMGLARLLKPKTSVNPASAAPLLLPSLPLWPGLAAVIWMLAALAVTEIWYRTHESKLVTSASWSVAWPAQSPQFKRTTLPETSLAILRCSNSEAASWDDADGNQWSAFLLRWSPGKNSTQLANGHRPDICFPAAGARLVEDFGETNLPSGKLELPFRHQTFASGSKLLHVFYCLWADRHEAGKNTLAESGTRNHRLDAVLTGQRHLGQQVLEIVLNGPESASEAVSAMKEQLPSLIREQ